MKVVLLQILFRIIVVHAQIQRRGQGGGGGEGPAPLPSKICQMQVLCGSLVGGIECI